MIIVNKKNLRWKNQFFLFDFFHKNRKYLNIFPVNCVVHWLSIRRSKFFRFFCFFFNIILIKSNTNLSRSDTYKYLKSIKINTNKNCEIFKTKQTFHLIFNKVEITRNAKQKKSNKIRRKGISNRINGDLHYVIKCNIK